MLKIKTHLQNVVGWGGNIELTKRALQRRERWTCLAGKLSIWVLILQKEE